jgi:hypothetical protein
MTWRKSGHRSCQILIYKWCIDTISIYIYTYIPNSSIPREWRGLTTVSPHYSTIFPPVLTDWLSTLNLTSVKFLAGLSKSHNSEITGSAGNLQTWNTSTGWCWILTPMMLFYHCWVPCSEHVAAPCGTSRSLALWFFLIFCGTGSALVKSWHTSRGRIQLSSSFS